MTLAALNPGDAAAGLALIVVFAYLYARAWLQERRAQKDDALRDWFEGLR